jgi:hypothetical protein
MDAKNEKMGWWWRRTIPSRGASALPPNICVHTEKVPVGRFRLVTPGRRRDRGMRHASSDDRSPFKYVSGTFGFAFSLHSLLRCCSTCGKNRSCGRIQRVGNLRWKLAHIPTRVPNSLPWTHPLWLPASPRSYKSSREEEEEEEEAQREFMGGPTRDISEVDCCTSIASL